MPPLSALLGSRSSGTFQSDQYWIGKKIKEAKALQKRQGGGTSPDEPLKF